MNIRVPSGIPGGGSTSGPSKEPGPFAQALASIFSTLGRWIGVALAAVFLAIVVVVFVGYGGYLVFSELLPAVGRGLFQSALTVFTFVTGFGWPDLHDLVGDIVAGALVGLAIGLIRFRTRRHTEVYERIAEVFGEPKLATIGRGQLTTIGFHMIAGAVAGLVLAWLGIPSPDVPVLREFTHVTPLLLLVAGGGAGGFPGGGGDIDWMTGLWLILFVVAITTVILGVGSGLVSYGAYASSGAGFAVSRVIALTWVVSIMPRLTSLRGVKVLPLNHRVAADYGEAYQMGSRDQLLGLDNMAHAVVGAAIYGALTGTMVATLLCFWKLVPFLLQ